MVTVHLGLTVSHITWPFSTTAKKSQMYFLMLHFGGEYSHVKQLCSSLHLLIVIVLNKLHCHVCCSTASEFMLSSGKDVGVLDGCISKHSGEVSLHFIWLAAEGIDSYPCQCIS